MQVLSLEVLLANKTNTEGNQNQVRVVECHSLHIALEVSTKTGGNDHHAVVLEE
jgi:sRNA-binding protein